MLMDPRDKTNDLVRSSMSSNPEAYLLFTRYIESSVSLHWSTYLASALVKPWKWWKKCALLWLQAWKSHDLSLCSQVVFELPCREFLKGPFPPEELLSCLTVYVALIALSMNLKKFLSRLSARLSFVIVLTHEGKNIYQRRHRADILSSLSCRVQKTLEWGAGMLLMGDIWFPFPRPLL